MAIASLALGAFALVFCWIPIAGWLAVVAAPLAIVFGIVGMRRTPGALGLVGIVLGSLGLLCGVGIQLFYLWAADAAVEGVNMLIENLPKK